MDKIFTKPDRPFLLLTRDDEDNESCYWLESEDELQEVASERKEYGEKIVDAIEIGSCREIKIPPEYTVDDFIEEINSTYDDAKVRELDSIVLTIETDTDQTYYINDTKDGFQCDEFNFYFDDLDSIAAALFDEIMIGKPVEIRIE